MRLAVLLVALTSACSTKKASEGAARPPAALEFTIEGSAQFVRLDLGDLRFCDARGSHHVDLKSGIAASDGSPCPVPAEPNAACSDLKFDVSVRAPLSEPNDIVDLGASSFPLRGRVHDCAAGGDYLAIGTGSAVVMINRVQNTMKETSAHGGDRVAVTQGWIAWTEGATIHLAPIR